MKQVFLIIFTIIHFQLKTFGSSNNICTDLAKYACAPISYDDGTGKSASFEFGKKEKVRDELQKQVKKEMSNLVDSLVGTQLEKDYLSSFGLDQDTCLDSKKISKQCRDALIDSLSQFAMDVEFSGKEMKDLRKKTDFNPELEDMVYIYTNPNFTDSLEKINQEFPSVNHDALKQKIKDDYFPQMKKIFIQQINSLPVSSEENRKKLIAKIDSIKLSTKACRSNKAVESEFINAHYTPYLREIQLCEGLFNSSSSLFSIIGVLSHELAHSIDPCSISNSTPNSRILYTKTNQAEMDIEYPIKNIISCLRSYDSIAAGPFIVKSNTNLYINYSYCESDDLEYEREEQIGESFSDWAGLNILFEFMDQHEKAGHKLNWKNGIMNIFKPFCLPAHERLHVSNDNLISHPATDNRINRLLLPHPVVQNKLGCEAGQTQAKYCDPKTYVPIKNGYQYTGQVVTPMAPKSYKKNKGSDR